MTYGKLVKVIIPQIGQDGEGCVFVEFKNIDDSKKARKMLQARKFNNKALEIEYFSEEKYYMMDFSLGDTKT